MSDTELKYPEWEAEFREVLIELSPKKLFSKIQKFETVVFVRLRELASSGDHHEEREAIDDALITVRLLKNEYVDRTT